MCLVVNRPCCTIEYVNRRQDVFLKKDDGRCYRCDLSSVLKGGYGDAKISVCIYFF